MGLSCDVNLVVLVILLFIGGAFLFSSLRTGVYTARLVVRFTRQSCGNGLKKQLARRRQRGRDYQFPATFGIVVSIVKAFAGLPPSAVQKIKASTFKRPCVGAQDGGPGNWPPAIKLVVQYCIPYRTISRTWGAITRIHLPFDWMKRLVYMTWTRLYDCKLEEMRYPLESYACLSEFFLRPLCDRARSVDLAVSPGMLTSPVDGKVLCVNSAELGDVSKVYLDQVKGVRYNLGEFVGALPVDLSPSQGACPPRKLHTIVMYLAPGDYHYFHSPTEWTILHRRHFPGALLPVRPWAVRQIPSLYCSNERVVLNGTWGGGFFSFAAVGALNVGSIGLRFDPELETNCGSHTFSCDEKTFATPVALTRGQLIGDFNLGSTVVLVFEAEEGFHFNVKPGETVRVGQRLGCQVDCEPRLSMFPVDGAWPVAAQQPKGRF